MPATATALSVEWCNGIVRKLLAEKPNIAAGHALPDIDSLAIMEGRRVNAAFVYSDLHGFSKLVATQLEENSFRFLQVFVKVASDLTKHYGGQVMDVAGDRVLSVFHRPSGNRSNEPVEDAITFALYLQTLFAKSISPAFGGSQGELSVAIGIDYGEVVAGCVGVRDGKRIVFFGNAANNAAKLQDAATGGETLISNVAFGMRPNYLKGSKGTPKPRIVPGLMPAASITQYFSSDQPVKPR